MKNAEKTYGVQTLRKVLAGGSNGQAPGPADLVASDSQDKLVGVDLTNFVMSLREINVHLREGRITPEETFLLDRLRHEADKYGQVSVNLPACRKDWYGNRITPSLFNRHLRSLVKKKYALCESHQGSRGRFQVQLLDFMRGDKVFLPGALWQGSKSEARHQGRSVPGAEHVEGEVDGQGAKSTSSNRE